MDKCMQLYLYIFVMYIFVQLQLRAAVQFLHSGRHLIMQWLVNQLSSSRKWRTRLMFGSGVADKRKWSIAIFCEHNLWLCDNCLLPSTSNRFHNLVRLFKTLRWIVNCKLFLLQAIVTCWMRHVNTSSWGGGGWCVAYLFFQWSRKSH